MRRIWSLTLIAALTGGLAVWAKSANNFLPTDLPKSEQVRTLQDRLQQARSSQEQAPLRYALASLLQDQGDQGSALTLLKGLEDQYPVLKERVLVKQAQVLASASAWQKVSALNGALKPEALYQLGLLDPLQWQNLIQSYPDHPRTAQALSRLIETSPDNTTYLRAYVTNFGDQPASVRYSQRLERQTVMSPAEWLALGKAYHANKEYQKAILALNRTSSPEGYWLLALSHQAIKQPGLAQNACDRLAQAFPSSPLAAQAQLLKGKLIPKSQRVGFLRQVAQRYPTVGAEALDLAAQNAANSPQLLMALIQQFPQSPEATEAAWELAWSAYRQGDRRRAFALSEQAFNNFGSEKYASPRLGFWAGRWAEELGETNRAQSLFRSVIQRFPASFYSWRSAVHLGLISEDFKARTLPVAVQIDQDRPSGLPAGSAALRELYRLGLIREALAQFQAENYQNEALSPALRATEALLVAQNGENLRALKQLLPLAYEESLPELHQSRGFWEAAYPTPHWTDLMTWSAQNQVNPLLALGLMRQESAFEPQIRSRVGATGLMQIMPATGKDIARSLGVTNYSLSNPKDNIRFGTWYLAYTHDRFQNNSLLAVASYNAGPGNVAKWVKTLPINDPELFIEQIPFKETKGYVKSVFGNYWNYLRLYSPEFQSQLNRIGSNRS